MLNLFAPLSFLGSIYGMIVQSLVDMQNLSDLLGEKPDVQDMEGAIALPINVGESVAVEFDKVKFTYKAQTSGLHGISFRVAAGTTTGIIGATGAGKTTISRLLFRFYDVESGEIRLNGMNVAQYTQQSVRRLIGIVPQDTCLFNATVLHNVSYGDAEAPFAAVEEACRKAQILDFINALPEKWQTKVGERGLKLSGGEKQRVAIARCLLKKPPVVVLDEATSALDTLTEQLVQEAIQRLSDSKRTFIVIAHRLSTVMNAEQIIVLAKGEILEKGSHHELLRANGNYAQMWHAQYQAEAALSLAAAPAHGDTL
jgi:ABC-type transport system involved in Fe-S cluster assembly fused permease/ATPase subunit